MKRIIPASRRRNRRSQTRSIVQTAIAITFLLAIAIPSFSLPAAAQTEGSTEVAATETPVVDDGQPTQTPVVAATETPGDEPTVTSTVAATETIVAKRFETPGSVEVTYWTCPPNVDLTFPDTAILTSSCVAQTNGITFQLSSLGGMTYTGDTGSRGFSKTGFMDVQPGAQTLRQIPPPESVVAVFCGGNTPEGTSTNYGPIFFDGTMISFDLLPAEIFQCDWYVTDPDLDDAALDTGSVRIIVRQCPAGFDPGAGNLDEYAFGCQEGGGQMEFSLTQTGSALPLTVTSTGGDGTNEANFSAVNSGPIAVSGTVPTGFAEPVVFCSSLSPVIQTRSMLVSNGDTIEWEMQGGQQMGCTWFSIQKGVGTIFINKLACPAGYDASAEDIYDLAANCHENVGAVDFSVADAGGQELANGTTSGAAPNRVTFNDVPEGSITIGEILPVGYRAPLVWCSAVNATGDQLPIEQMSVLEGSEIAWDLLPGQMVSCDWWNIPSHMDSTVTITKWECPEGMSIDPTHAAHASACTQPMDGVEFTLTDSNGPRSLATAGGQVEWTDVQTGPVSIAETIPGGYHPQPFVVCGWTATSDGALIDGPVAPVETINGVFNTTITYPGTHLFCDWYNQYAGAGEVTIYKWTCPEGYDPFAWKADPKAECIGATNGVTFVLDQPDDVDLQTTTGDSMDGAVYFGGLPPGDYSVTEIVPDGIATVFVLDCVGLHTGSVHPVPLSVGPSLDMHIAGGDSIVCDWYNVPELDPELGRMTIAKYHCWTPTYVSEVDCEVFEDGIGFDLQTWDGSAWVDVTSGTTNGAGNLTFTGLDPGTYRLVEHNGTPCRTDASLVDADNNPAVQQNTETVVKVYNCSSAPPSPGGEMPTKYPNTGVAPEGTERQLPAASLLALIGLAGFAPMTRRQLVRRAAAPALAAGAGSVWLGSTLAGQDIEPIGTPIAGTPAANCLYPATPSAAPAGTPAVCPRGEVPARISIGIIEVDAGIEILETIGGEMQAPTGAETVAWYKESARLGEQGNILMAGHLNYWGVPEGVFFKLEALQEGDAVEVEGDSGGVYRYNVEWLEAYPADQQPPVEALGHTQNQSLTLITCGGEWNADNAEYDHRIVVRAVRDENEAAS